MIDFPSVGQDEVAPEGVAEEEGQEEGVATLWNALVPVDVLVSALEHSDDQVTSQLDRIDSNPVKLGKTG